MFLLIELVQQSTKEEQCENYYFATITAKGIRARIIEFKKKSTMKSKIFGGA